MIAMKWPPVAATFAHRRLRHCPDRTLFGCALRAERPTARCRRSRACPTITPGQPRSAGPRCWTMWPRQQPEEIAPASAFRAWARAAPCAMGGIVRTPRLSGRCARVPGRGRDQADSRRCRSRSCWCPWFTQAKNCHQRPSRIGQRPRGALEWNADWARAR